MKIYYMPYKIKGKCIYKKKTGEKVGCTKGSIKKYLAALQVNVSESSDLMPLLNFNSLVLKLINKN